METKEPLMNFRPLFTVAIFFIIGIVMPIIYFTLGLLVYLITAVVVLSLIVILAFIRSKKFKKISYFAYAIALAFLIFGNVILFSRVFYNLNAEKYGYEEISGYVYKINSKEDVSNGYKYGMIVNAKLGGKTEKIYTVITTDKEITVYTNIIIKGKINNYYCNDPTFNVYPLTENMRYSTTEPSIIQIGGIKNGVVSKLRNYLYTTLKKYCPENYGVINAILTGDTSGMNNYSLNTYRRLGVAHIFAVSGLHVGFLYTAITFILKLFKVKQKRYAYFVPPVLFLYIAFCGFTASCLRAFIMITIKVITDSFGFKRDSVNSVSTGAIIVLTVNPSSLFTIGFQLSFLAYVGIILFTKPCINLFSKILPLKFSEFLAPYVVAYLSTLPIIVDCFHYLAPFAIIFNIFVIPIIGVIYVASFIISILLMISPIFKVLGLIPDYVFKFANLIMNNINDEFFLIRNLRFAPSTVFYYSSFIVTLDKFNITKTERIILFSILFTCFLASFIIINLA